MKVIPFCAPALVFVALFTLHATPAEAAPLKWAPPAQVSASTTNVTTGFYTHTFADDEDVVLVMPGSARTSDMSITGGRNIRIIGGNNGTGRMQFTNVTGSVYIEGVRQALVAHKDAINISGKTGYKPDVYLQNMFITGVFGVNADPAHADIFQPQGPIGNIYIQGLTGDTNYQGLFLAGNSGGITSATLSRVNLKYNAITPSDSFTFLYWFGDDTAGSPLYPVQILHSVYAEPRSGQTIADSSVHPKTGDISSSTPIGAIADTNGNVTWPAASLITGTIYTGAPVGGDFIVPGGTGPGTSYTSPGYDSAAPSLSSIGSADISTSTVSVNWNTNENASTLLEYGTTTAYGVTTTETATTTGEMSHAIALSGLSPNTTYHYRVYSTDPSDNTATSTDKTFITSVLPDITMPSVSITAPSDSISVSGSSVTISADAADNDAVAGVKFYYDSSNLIGTEVTTAPYSVVWDSTGVSVGAHTLIAVARDSAGNFATSSSVTVTVQAAVTHSSGAGGTSAKTKTLKSIDRYLDNHDAEGLEAYVQKNEAKLRRYLKSGTDLPEEVLALLDPSAGEPVVTTPVDSVTSAPTPVRDLEMGHTGKDVIALQKFLNGNGFTVAASGPGAPGSETELFGALTRAALIKFQASRGISPAAGYFGPITRAKITSEGLVGAWW